MDWRQQGIGYFNPFNGHGPTYPYSGYETAGGDTGYVEFEGDDDDHDMYEPEELDVGAEPEPVQPVTATVPAVTRLDGTPTQSDSKAQPTEPKTTAGQLELATLREKLLAQKQRKSNTPAAEPKAAPATQESTMSADVDNLIAEERAAAEAVSVMNTPAKVVTPTGNNGTFNKAQLSHSKQVKSSTTDIVQGVAPVPASSMKNPAAQSIIKNNGPTGPGGSPKITQKTAQSHTIKQIPPSQLSLESGEVRETKMGLNARLTRGKEVAKPTRLRGGTDTDAEKNVETAQPERKNSNTDNMRNRQEPAASMPRQTNSRPSNKNMTHSEATQKPTQAPKINGEKNHAVPNVNTTNRESTVSTKQVQKDRYPERMMQGERQTEPPARRMAVPHARNLESQTDGRNSTQRQLAEKAPNNAMVLSASRNDARHEIQRVGAEPISSNAAAHSHYFDDLDEWLEATGYHDQSYRQKALNRHRALAHLERERERIDREYSLDEDNSTYLVRPGSSRISVRPAPIRRVTSTSSMAPPPLPALTPTAKTFEDIPGHSNVQAQSKRPLSPSAFESVRPDKQVRLDAVPGAQQRQDEHTDLGPRSAGHEKGPLSPYSVQNGEHGFRIRGVMDEEEISRGPLSRPQSSRGRIERSLSPRGYPPRRISFTDERVRRDEDDRDMMPRGAHPNRRGTEREITPPRAHYTRARSPVEYHRGDFNSGYRPGTSAGGYDTSPTYHNERGRGRGHGRGSFSSRGGPRSFQRDMDRPLHLGAGGARYFMIKSWNHENVDTAQREGVWATQPHNEELLAKAFKTCRHVILVFSVNKSMAFQGYARMQSAPGEAPTPSWTKNLLWPTSGPFFIRWITIADVRFSRVGHLKNSLNEGLAVLVGRDGQEIEEECGRLLCESIDDVGRTMKMED